MLLFCLRQQFTASFIYELAGHMRRLIHVTHLLPVVLMDERVSALRHAGGMQARACARMGCVRDDHAQVQAGTLSAATGR